MKTILKAVCDKAFITRDTNNLNLIGIFEDIYANKFPATHPEFYATFVIEGDLKEANKANSYHFDITSSSGEKILDTKSQPHDFKLGMNGRGNVIISIRNTTFPKEGLYDFNLYIGDEFKETIPIRVLPAGA